MAKSREHTLTGTRGAIAARECVPRATAHRTPDDPRPLSRAPRARLRGAHRPVRVRGRRPARARRGRVRSRPHGARQVGGRAGADRGLRGRGQRRARRGAAGPGRPPGRAGRADRPLHGRPDRRAIRPAVRRRARRARAVRAGASAAGTCCGSCSRSMRCPTGPSIRRRSRATRRSVRRTRRIRWSGTARSSGPPWRPSYGTLETIAKSGDVGALPLLWLHGDDDRIVPLPGSRAGVEELRGADWTERVYRGRPARGVQRDEQGRGPRGRDRLRGPGARGLRRIRAVSSSTARAPPRNRVFPLIRPGHPRPHGVVAASGLRGRGPRTVLPRGYDRAGAARHRRRQARLRPLPGAPPVPRVGALAPDRPPVCGAARARRSAPHCSAP